MAEPPPSNPGEAAARLQRCIRDLSALNALPSMCIGRSPDETIELVMDALPTALSCALVYLQLPGTPPKEYATLHRRVMAEANLAAVRAVIGQDTDGADTVVALDRQRIWCLEAAVPLGAQRGRLLVGRGAPLDPETDRVLVRNAANIVGTTVENANVLEVARRKDDFLAMLGHELRNPLAPIMTAVELLARNPSASREQKVIDRHTRHLARLVDDLLDISRVTRGHVELRNEQVSLASVLERGVELASPLIARHKHSLRTGDAKGIMLRGDPVRLAQIFSNLLTNAAKFTPPGGQIDVSVERRPDGVRVVVTDNGRGIGQDQLRRIFEPFVQADRDRDALQGGLGLGLAIVRNLIERHGGTITAHSDGPGRGAAFTVELPTVAEVQPTPVAAAPQTAPSAREGVRVLVVDDNVDIAELLSEALRDEGFETEIAHDGRAALAAWGRFLPHAAVLDVGLPDIDGYELAKAVRAEYGAATTLIAATGYGQAKDRSAAAEAGFDIHMVKPVSVYDLITVLDQHRASAG